MAAALRECLALGLLLAGCGSQPLSSEPPGKPAQGAPAPAALGVASLIGSDDMPPALVPVYAPSANRLGFYPTALAFNPAVPGDLWITLRQPPTDQVCDHDSTGCDWLIGRVAIVHGAGVLPDDQLSVETKEDANAWHFMRRPTSISFAPDDLFGTCAEARTSNFEDESVPFNGPVLWSADPAIFGVEPPPKSPTNSTHLDMMHESPYCMGIAHERDNVYWVFNGDAGSLDRYDFHQPHEPGGDDHSDGEVWRYVTGELERVPEVPSHLAFDADTSLLYAADTGHGRIVVLDTTTGTAGADIEAYDPIATHLSMVGAKLTELVPPGVLVMPSGLTLYQGVLFVTDASTSRIAAFDLEGRLLGSVDTGLPEGALAGIAIGPDGHAYIADASSAGVLRLDPAGGS